MRRTSAALLFFLAAVLLLRGEPLWRAGPPAADAVALESGHGESPVLARLQIGPDWHPGVARGAEATTPYRGRVERATRFEVAVNAKAVWVAAGQWEQATSLGHQSHSEVYLCRAPVHVGEANAGWAYGKAYRTGPHGGRAYLACDGREIELREGFQLLRLEPTAP